MRSSSYVHFLLLLCVTWTVSLVTAESTWYNVCDDDEDSISLADGEVQFLTVPGFPTAGSSSSSWTNCITRAIANPGQQIRVTFHYFYTESCCDYLRIYNGLTTSGTALLERSGSSVPSTVTSTGNSLTFRWSNDGWGSNNGFLLSLKAIPDVQEVAAANVTAGISELKTEMQEKMESFSLQLNTTLQGLKSMEHETVTKKDLADALVAMYERIRTKLNVSTKKVIDALPKCSP